jgi:hypothetical protein
VLHLPVGLQDEELTNLAHSTSQLLRS